MRDLFPLVIHTITVQISLLAPKLVVKIYKQETSAILRPFNVTILGLACAVYLWRGYFTLHTLGMMAIAIPATLIATQIGVALYKRISDSTFRRLLLWLMIGGGLSLIAREVLFAAL